MKIPDRYWEGKTPIEARLPWLTPKAIEAIDAFAKPHHTVLELGGGGSTLFFADRCKSVLTWEPDIAWRLRIAKLLGKASPRSIVCDDLMMVLDNSARKAITVLYDIVLCDTSNPWAHQRNVTGRALNCVGQGGLFILDNYARYPLKFLDGWKLTTYDDPHWDGKGTLLATKPVLT